MDDKIAREKAIGQYYTPSVAKVWMKYADSSSERDLIVIDQDDARLASPGGRAFAIIPSPKIQKSLGLRNVAFIPEGSNSNTKLHELGHIDYATKEKKYFVDNYKDALSHELAAELFVAKTKHSDTLSGESLLDVMSSIMSDFGVSAKSVVAHTSRFMHKKGYRFGPEDRRTYLRILENK